MNEDARVINLGFVNAYLIKAGDDFVLVDTGTAQQWPRLENELLQAGCLPDHLKLAFITHGDFDHTGNCAVLQQKYHTKIGMHAGDVEMVMSGLPAKRKAKGLLGRLFTVMAKFIRGNFSKFQPDVLLEDGQDLAEYGLAGRVIYTPGHTKGSIALLTSDGQLFSGDTVSNQGKLSTGPFVENEEDLRASLLILKGLKARRVYPGHGKPFDFEELAAAAG
ncbi:MAG: MBL fold metallo-hydrolase [Anaerolineaceae bacterium]|nr:MBL fold metallo-hydrolase [Anaerolineaceae bacterium]